jgi:hypothetical protein
MGLGLYWQKAVVTLRGILKTLEVGRIMGSHVSTAFHHASPHSLPNSRAAVSSSKYQMIFTLPVPGWRRSKDKEEFI